MATYRNTALITAEAFLPEQGQIPAGVFSDGMGDPGKNPNHTWVIDTPQGRHILQGGEYVCTARDGSRSVVAKDAFERTHAEVAPDAGADILANLATHLELSEGESGTVADCDTALAIAGAIRDLLAQRATLLAAMADARACLEGEPDYHHQGMGCGLEDRGITDRYEAMEYGWEKAMDRVYGEHVNEAKDILDGALPAAAQTPAA